MKQKGMYSYIKSNINIKTKYVIEYTQDKKVFSIMDTAKFDFEMLKKIELDYLQDAINVYNVLYYNESTLHIMLYEQIILNDEIILEQSKDMQSINILDQHTQNKINAVETQNKELQEYLKQIELALKKYNMTTKQLLDSSKNI